MSRASVESELYSILDRVTQSKDNSTRYKEVFSKMSDKDFKLFFEQIGRGERKLIVFFPHYDTARMEMSVVIKEAEKIGLDFFDTLEATVDGISVTSAQEAMRLLVPIRRLAQTLDAKISVADDDGKIDAMTGQVTSDSKAASISAVELSVLTDIGLSKSAAEVATVRGGDGGAYAYLKAATASTGRASLLGAMEYRTGVGSKKAVRVLLMGRHIGTNL